MDAPLSRWARIRTWWAFYWKEVILLCAVGLISAAITVLVLWYFFPIPGTK
jgi:hypothetical protein